MGNQASSENGQEPLIPNPPSGSPVGATLVQNPAPSSELQSVLKGVEMIHELEAEHKLKLAKALEAKKDLKEFEKSAFELVKSKEEEYKQELIDAEAHQTRLYEAKMADQKSRHETELENLIHHVNTKVITERRSMQNEDALAFIIRELETQWNIDKVRMKTSHKQEIDFTRKQFRTIYDKKLEEICNNFNAEYKEIQNKKLTKSSEKKSRKRGGGSLWDIFSPSKRTKEGSGSDDDDDDIGEDSD